MIGASALAAPTPASPLSSGMAAIGAGVDAVAPGFALLLDPAPMPATPPGPAPAIVIGVGRRDVTMLCPAAPGADMPCTVTPGPVTFGPVTPGPVTPGPVTPGPVTPGPVMPDALVPDPAVPGSAIPVLTTPAPAMVVAEPALASTGATAAGTGRKDGGIDRDDDAATGGDGGASAGAVAPVTDPVLTLPILGMPILPPGIVVAPPLPSPVATSTSTSASASASTPIRPPIVMTTSAPAMPLMPGSTTGAASAVAPPPPPPPAGMGVPAASLVAPATALAIRSMAFVANMPARIAGGVDGGPVNATAGQDRVVALPVMSDMPTAPGAAGLEAVPPSMPATGHDAPQQGVPASRGGTGDAPFATPEGRPVPAMIGTPPPATSVAPAIPPRGTGRIAGTATIAAPDAVIALAPAAPVPVDNGDLPSGFAAFPVQVARETPVPVRFAHEPAPETVPGDAVAPFSDRETRPVDTAPPLVPAFSPPADAPRPAAAIDPSTQTVIATPIADTLIHHRLDLARGDQWLDQLARDIATTAANEGELRFRLNPEHLGSLAVEVKAGADGAQVRLSAETEQARAIIADAQHRLVAEARAQGFRIADAQVDLSGRQSSSQHQSQQQQARPPMPDARPQGHSFAPEKSAAVTVNQRFAARAERYA